MYDAFPRRDRLDAAGMARAHNTSLGHFGLAGGCALAGRAAIAALLIAGLFGAVFAQYWPLERGTMPGFCGRSFFMLPGRDCWCHWPTSPLTA